MAPSLIKCNKCLATVFPDDVTGASFSACPSCQSLLAVEIFPALFKPPAATSAAQPILAEGEASCFYHPEKKAAFVCANCGRFICGLCDLELNGRHLCPTCLETGQKKSKFKDLENSRVLWDRVALMVAVVPLLFLWTSIIGAPTALYLAIRYRNAPGSITGGTKGRFVLAGILAVLQIIAWAAVLTLIFTRKR